MSYEEQKRKDYERDVAEVAAFCDSDPSFEILRDGFMGTVEFIHHMRMDPKFLRELEHRHA